jgi:hypothetical protein
MFPLVAARSRNLDAALYPGGAHTRLKVFETASEGCSSRGICHANIEQARC